MMQFNWKPYRDVDASLVDSWIDDDAISQTGLEDGWKSFYDYWMRESPGEGKDCCFLISQDDLPFAVMYLAITGGEITISEYIVAPDKRGKGYGTAVLIELLENRAHLLNIPGSLVKAVVFPGNLASAKALEKAGFVLASGHLNDDVFHYEYRFS